MSQDMTFVGFLVLAVGSLATVIGVLLRWAFNTIEILIKEAREERKEWLSAFEKHNERSLLIQQGLEQILLKLQKINGGL